MTLLQQAFSYAIYDNRQEVNIFDIERAILNTKNVYPDIIKKEIPHFKEVFKQEIEDGLDRGFNSSME